MTNALVQAATLQVVRQGSNGGLFVSSGIVQVISNAHVDRILVSLATAQVIRQGSEGGDMRLSTATLQVVRAGSEGGVHTVPHATPQVVWTIGVNDITRQRAWTFDLDGHTFYVLDLGERGTLLYDIVTQQWTKFETEGYDGHWNMKNGHHWKGGKQILAGDTQNGTVWKLDPSSFFDDGWRPLVYEVRGMIFIADVDTHRQFALRLIGSAGRTTDNESPKLNMQFSDDLGATWSQEFEITLTMDSKQRIEWRSLGSFTQPGRLFRLYDTGGVKFISMVMADMEGE